MYESDSRTQAADERVSNYWNAIFRLFLANVRSPKAVKSAEVYYVSKTQTLFNTKFTTPSICSITFHFFLDTCVVDVITFRAFSANIHISFKNRTIFYEKQSFSSLSHSSFEISLLQCYCIWKTNIFVTISVTSSGKILLQGDEFLQ